MSVRPSPLIFPPDEAASWQRVRRYAVPRWMIEQAAERRLAGDWRGACAVAGVDVAFDLAGVAREYGAAVAAELEDDLRHLAPDLLRWHLPRILHGHTTLATGEKVVLAGYGPPGRPEVPRLHVATPLMTGGPQRLTLRLGRVHDGRAPGWSWSELSRDWAAARHLWDVRHTAELRLRCGGGNDRAPFFDADGTPRTAADLPAADPGHEDPAARTEWVTSLHEEGMTAAAFAAVGIDLDMPEEERTRWHEGRPLDVMKWIPLVLTRLGPEMRRLADEGEGDRFHILYGWNEVVMVEPGPDRGRLRCRLTERQKEAATVLPEACWRRLPDLDLLRDARISPDHLHPLVRASLFPGRPDTGGPYGPPDPPAPAPVRVRCRGEWHEVAARDGGLQMPHSAVEQQRERAMRAFGGAVAGCFAVQQAWTSGSGRLPRVLRAQRRELFERAQHGDTPGVLRLLDGGFDPHVRDGMGRTLLHVLNLLDHEPLLPRLLAAGLGLEAEDQRERTPLHTAVAERGSADLVRALLAAGARIDAVDQEGLSLGNLIHRYKRRDLEFLRKQGIGAGLWPDEPSGDA
ncbi:ankyrin repeat domain-containing protein [Planomonospora sp. ID67723]|uniref:ankyrin repeat domain-containing protein n=1 Tax=Planomonospora sp. ID67723 TaxID=2738134 RepID=UPI0018C3EE6B|nr:ankyrin repeat domain-containing protein [Planomonospora sp. ID67723]MBG0828740.1 ankyrin repeat domain-containing protein [Planomonospora sp. ID67723]